MQGLDKSSHAVTVNRLCGSGLEAIVSASQQIQLGEVDVAVAGGVESMSRATYSSFDAALRRENGSLLHLKMTCLPRCTIRSEPDIWALLQRMSPRHLALIERAQDAFAEESHKRAIAAIEEGRFKEQIIPFELKSRKGVVVFEQDEHPRADVSQEGLSELKPAFKREERHCNGGQRFWTE